LSIKLDLIVNEFKLKSDVIEMLFTVDNEIKDTSGYPKKTDKHHNFHGLKD